MKKIKWCISLDPAMTEGEFYAPDHLTEDEIEDLAKDEAFNGVDWGWSEDEEI